MSEDTSQEKSKELLTTQKQIDEMSLEMIIDHLKSETVELASKRLLLKHLLTRWLPFDKKPLGELGTVVVKIMAQSDQDQDLCLQVYQRVGHGYSSACIALKNFDDYLKGAFQNLSSVDRASFVVELIQRVSRAQPQPRV